VQLDTKWSLPYPISHSQIGLSLVIAGGVKVFNASVSKAIADGNSMETRLAGFLDCEDIKHTTGFAHPEDHDYVMVSRQLLLAGPFITRNHICTSVHARHS